MKEEEARFWSELLGVTPGPAHTEGGVMVYFREAWTRWCALAGLSPPRFPVQGPPATSETPEVRPTKATTTRPDPSPQTARRGP